MTATLPAVALGDVAASARRAASTLRRALAFAVALGVTMRLAYSLYGWLHLLVARPAAPVFHGNWENLAPSPSSATFPWLGPWEHLDALWYKEIAVAGYQAGNGTVHFPPLFPLLARLAMPLFAGSFGFAAMAVNLLAAVIAFSLLCRLAALEGDAEAGARAALYMCAFPVGFFLFAPFTEATFLALTVASLYWARQGRWWWAGLWGFLAALARWQGVLLAPALLVEYALQARSGKRRSAPSALAIVLPGLAYGLYTLYARYVVGEPRSMTQLNADWGIRWLPPWAVLERGWRVGMQGDGLEVLNLVAIAFVALTILIGLRRQRPTYVVYAAAQWLFTVSHVSAVSPLASSARYLLTVFPAFLLLGRAGANPRLHQAIVVGCFLVQGIFLWQFVAGDWVA